MKLRPSFGDFQQQIMDTIFLIYQNEKCIRNEEYSLDGLKKNLNTAEERTGEPKHRSIESIQTETNKQTRITNIHDTL